MDVYYNGSKLSTSEYTATTGSTVVLGTACALNDIVETIAWTISSSFNPSLGSASATSLAIGGATIGSNALAVTGTTALSDLLTAAGGVSSTLTTDATSATTGSITTAGGISCQKQAVVGTLLGVGGVPPAGVPIYVTATGAYVQLNSTTGGYSNITGFDSGTQRWSIGQNAFGGANGMQFFYGTTEGMRLNSSGHLFINTTSDMGHLNVGGAVSCFSGGTANVASNISIDFYSSTGRIQAYGPNTSTNGSLSLSTTRSNGSNPKTMTLDTSGNLSLPGNITPAATTTVSVSTNSWSASTWYDLIAAGSLAQGAYWVSMRWDHTGGFPYIIAASFMVSVINTNGTGADTQITLLATTHTGGGATAYVRAVSGNSSTTGFQVQFTAIQAGTLTANFYKFA